MEITGKLHEIGEVEQVTDKFSKREAVLLDDSNADYPEYIKVEFTQDKTAELDKFNVGDYVEVGINLRGRPWTNKDGKTVYFNSINGWRIKEVEKVANASEVLEESDEDELPF